MKILHMTQSVGGVEIYLCNLLENYNFANDTVFECILPSHSIHLIELCDKLNIKYYPVKMTRDVGLLLDLKNIFLFKKIIKKSKPDLVHLHSSKAGFVGRIICKKLKINSIFTPHGVSYVGFRGVKRIAYYLMEVYAKRYTQKMLNCSYSEANRMIYEVGIPQEHISVLLNSIPLKNEFTDSLEKTNPVIEIGIIARLTYLKNPILFVEIAKKILTNYENVQFSILGEGYDDDQKDAFYEKIDEYNLRDKILVHQWGDKSVAEEYLRKLDIFLMTSIVEGLPLSLLEAMSLGIPCVVNKCDGCNDVISNNENGFACISVDEFAEKISRLIEDKDLAKRIGKAGKEYVIKNHDIKEYVKKLKDYYIGLLM